MIAPAVTHHTRLGPARDQGRRPTCLLFCTTDLNADENACAEPLSVDYLAHQIDQLGHSWRTGTTLSAVKAALVVNGQPPERSYPYDSADFDRPTYTPGLVAGPFYCADVRATAPSFGEAQRRIERGKPVGLLLGVKPCLFSPRAGVIIDRVEPENNGGHAVIGVGVGGHRVTNEPHILIRNSWGESWGDRGHAWLPRSYFQSSLKDVFELANGHII